MEVYKVMEKIEYIPEGVCSKRVDIVIENGVVGNVEFTGGCNGNLRGIAQLVKGMEMVDVIDRLKDIKCGSKSTSCPDQLAKALEQYLK